MSWQDNRRRKRTWYKHYKKLCDRLVFLVDTCYRDSKPLASEAIIEMFYDLYEERRLHKRKRVASSARSSLELAVKDAGLNAIAIGPSRYDRPDMRPPCFGEFPKPNVKTNTNAETNVEVPF